MFGSAWAIGLDQRLYMDTSPYLAEMSASKRSVGLDLKHAAARHAALALLANADVFVTNYSTPAVRALGFSYEDVAAVNPEIVYVALPGFGSDPTQPYYEFLAWGPNQAPLVGLDDLTGYPDQVPAGIATISPPDYFAGLHALTARAHRARAPRPHRRGQLRRHRPVRDDRVRASDRSSSTTSSAGTPRPLGNRLEWLAPQGVLPVRRRGAVGGGDGGRRPAVAGPGRAAR